VPVLVDGGAVDALSGRLEQRVSQLLIMGVPTVVEQLAEDGLGMLAELERAAVVLRLRLQTTCLMI
jgi:hypothetical protein